MKLWPFDAYDTKARAYPLVAVGIPFVMLVGASSADLWNLFVGLAGLAGMSAVLYVLIYILHQWVRDSGYELEKQLWRSWGGPPTTRFLRHSDSTFSEEIKKAYHAKIARLNPGWSAPSKDEEKRNPKKADEKYEAAIKWLKANATKAPRYNLVNEANIRYGFRRNCLGIKPYGLLSTYISAVVAGYLLAGAWPVHERGWLLVCSLVIIMAMAFFWHSVSGKFVHRAATVYAERLLECLDAIK